jgi:hypothetical protein
MTKVRIAFATLSLVLALAPGEASAAEKKGGPRKVLRLDAITVEGKIQKPQAFYILQRSNLNFNELDRVESFLPKVVASVEKDVF